MERDSKYFRLVVGMAMVVLSITWSCQLEEEPVPQTVSETDREGMTKLGKQLENPYSVVNMKKALESLNSSNSNGRTSGEKLEINATHLYIKYIPKSKEELDILARDSTLILYDYPLDYEIDQAGDFYHDPDVPLDQPTPQYCAVEVDYTFPSGVEYEVLEELFIPDDYSDNSQGRHSSVDATDEVIASLVYEALKITNNLENYNQKKETRSRGSRWRPETGRNNHGMG